MPQLPDRPRDPAGKTPRKTYRLDQESLDRIDRAVAYYGYSATDAIRNGLALLDQQVREATSKGARR
jgi:Arc/MetJ-type ribon-helix-helix transcriptional regulator